LEHQRFDFDRVSIAVDFVNSVRGQRQVNPKERLHGWTDLVDWAEQGGLLSKAQARQRRAWLRMHPQESERAFKEAVQLREGLHELLMAGIEKRPAPAKALGEINEWIADAHQHHRFGADLTRGFDLDEETLGFLWPVALDAEHLLQSEMPAELVRVCDESLYGRCGWIFIDQSRNHTRRFCCMKDCGNRAKQRRFQERKRAEP